MASSGPSDTGPLSRTASEQATASPSPSPALSAYTSSSVSSLDEYDLNNLALDDWGYPQQRKSESTIGRNGGSALNISAKTLSRQDHLSGASTPIAKHQVDLNRSNSTSSGLTQVVGSAEDDDDEDSECEPSAFDVEDEDEDDMHAYGVPAARGWRLKAK